MFPLHIRHMGVDAYVVTRANEGPPIEILEESLATGIRTAAARTTRTPPVRDDMAERNLAARVGRTAGRASARSAMRHGRGGHVERGANGGSHLVQERVDGGGFTTDCMPSSIA